MNNDAADGLGLLVDAKALGCDPDLGHDLWGVLSRGLIRNGPALIFAVNDRGLPNATTGAGEVMARMGWDATRFECNTNSFHLDDHAPVTVTDVDDEPYIGPEDRVVMLRLGLKVAHAVSRLARALPEPVPVRCIISAGPTNGTFRFHQLRHGESLIMDDLDAYGEEMIVVVDA
jgi:hypothetical protein